MGPPLPYNGFSPMTMRHSDKRSEVVARTLVAFNSSQHAGAEKPRLDSGETLADIRSDMAKFLSLREAPQGGSKQEVAWNRSPKQKPAPAGRSLLDERASSKGIQNFNGNGNCGLGFGLDSAPFSAASSGASQSPRMNGGSANASGDLAGSFDVYGGGYGSGVGSGRASDNQQNLKKEGSFSTWIKFSSEEDAPMKPSTSQITADFSRETKYSAHIQSGNSPPPLQKAELSPASKQKPSYDPNPPPPYGMTAYRAEQVALALQKKGEYAKALQHFSWALDLWGGEKSKGRAVDPNDLMPLYRESAECRKELGDINGAITTCCAALAIDCNAICILELRATLYEMSEKYALAVKDYEQLHRLAPSSLRFAVEMKRVMRYTAK